MADDSKAAKASELDKIAEHIFAERITRGDLHLPAEEEAMQSYRHAKAFLAARARVATGELERAEDRSAPKGPKPLQDSFAPNLPKTNPHNLISQEHGNRDIINRVAKWLKANPPVEGADEQREQTLRFNSEHANFNWDPPTLNSARTLLPAYASN